MFEFRSVLWEAPGPRPRGLDEKARKSRPEPPTEGSRFEWGEQRPRQGQQRPLGGRAVACAPVPVGLQGH